ncbi:hypothetical protein BGC31_06080 [Komagataeibacter xylinus]|nr:putative glycosyltransferase, group 1 family protein [Komagataeibacter xylinus E25]RFP01294.1 hypothetical protein BFX83_03520 [Komagataeibacter xylinus]RFP05423.1 hypothetical protein BGC31_06080 [Komagataeibacter xylinus]
MSDSLILQVLPPSEKTLTRADLGLIVEDARRLVRSGQFQVVVSMLEPLQEEAAVTRDMKSLLAQAYEGVGERHKARLLWLEVERAGTPAEGNGRHLWKLGNGALERGDYDEAERLFTSFLQVCPGDLAAAERLLEARMNRADGRVLRRVYAEHLAAWPETANSAACLADHVLRHDTKAEALKVLEHAESLWEGSLPAALRIAQIFQGVNEPDRALAVQDRAAALYSNNIALLRSRFRTRQIMGAPKDELLKAIDHLISLEPDIARYHVMRARLCANFKDWAGAAKAWETSLRLDDTKLAYWRGLINALGKLERNAAIDALIAKARQHFRSGGAEGLVDLSILETSIGEHKRAVKLAVSAMSNPRMRMRAREAASAALLAAGDYVRAWSFLSGGLEDGTASIETERMAARCSASLLQPAVTSGRRRFPDALFERALLHPPARTLIEPGDAVMLVTSSLGAGGAERQVAYSAGGVARLRAAAGRGPTWLVAQDMAAERGRAVMMPVAANEHLQMEDLGPIDQAACFRKIAAEDVGAREALRIIAAMPTRISRDVIKLYDCFRRHRPGLVHLWQDGVISTGSVAAVLAGVPRIVCSTRNVVAQETDRRRYRSYLATMYRCLAQRSDVRLTANSGVGAEDYEKWLGLEPGSIAVIRNGVETASVQKRGNPEARAMVRERLGLGPDNLLMGGTFRLAPAKRPHLWLSVAEIVAAQVPEARFTIVGDGVLRAELEQWIAAHGLADRVTLAGRQSPVEPWIAAMDVMLLASEVEGLPNVLLEAQTLGVPVVTTDAGGSREAVIQDITGYLVRDDKAENLAAAVIRVMQDRTFRLKARTGAPAFIEQRFGLQRMLGDTMSLYDTGFPLQGRVG